jgi:serine O-acetyltransferase
VALAQCEHEIGRRSAMMKRLRLFGPVRLWRLSIALQQRGLRPLAVLVKNVNSALYHNSLPPGAVVGADFRLEHHGFGTVIHTNVVIGRGVKIHQNVTIAMRAGSRSPYRIYIDDGVLIGANCVIISPHHANLRIGRGARIGAGAVVTADVPPGYTVVSAAATLIAPDGQRTTLTRARERDHDEELQR